MVLEQSIPSHDFCYHDYGYRSDHKTCRRVVMTKANRSKMMTIGITDNDKKTGAIILDIHATLEKMIAAAKPSAVAAEAHSATAATQPGGARNRSNSGCATVAALLLLLLHPTWAALRLQAATTLHLLRTSYRARAAPHDGGCVAWRNECGDAAPSSSGVATSCSGGNTDESSIGGGCSRVQSWQERSSAKQERWRPMMHGHGHACRTRDSLFYKKMVTRGHGCIYNNNNNLCICII